MNESQYFYENTWKNIKVWWDNLNILLWNLTNVFERNILWIDESKFCRFGSDGKQYLWRPPNLEHHLKYTLKTAKHDVGNL